MSFIPDVTSLSGLYLYPCTYVMLNILYWSDYVILIIIPHVLEPTRFVENNRFLIPHSFEKLAVWNEQWDNANSWTCCNWEITDVCPARSASFLFALSFGLSLLGLVKVWSLHLERRGFHLTEWQRCLQWEHPVQLLPVASGNRGLVSGPNSNFWPWHPGYRSASCVQGLCFRVKMHSVVCLQSRIS